MANPESKFVITAEDRASATLRRVGAEFGALGGATASATRLLGTFGVTLSAGAVASGFLMAIKSTTDLQDRMGKLAQQTGVNVQALTELDYAAKLSDVSTEELGTGLTRLTSKMADVAQGSKEAAAVFDALGVKVTNADGSLRSSEEVLKDVAQRFSEFEDGSTKTAIAVEIFGRAGAKLIPMLNQGRDGLAGAAEEARRLGIVFGEQAAKAAEELNDNLTRLGKAAEGLKVQYLSPLIEELARMSTAFLNASRAGSSFFQSLLTGFRAAARGGSLFEQLDEIDKALKDKQGLLESYQSNVVGRASLAVQNLITPPGALTLEQQIEQLKRDREAIVRQLGVNQETGSYGDLVGEPPGAGAAPRFTPAGGRSAASRAVGNTVDEEERFREFLAKLETDLDESERKAIADETERNRARSDSWRDVLEPSRKYAEQLEEIIRLTQLGRNAGGLSETEGAMARFLVGNELDGVMAGKPDSIKDQTKAATNAAREFGFTFTSALEESILSGKKLSDVINSLSQDFARMFLRKSVTEPLANWASGLFGGLFGGASHATGLDYVPYDGYRAILHRGERVQTAAEARGGGKSTTIQQNITFQGNVDRAQMAAYAARIQESTLAAIRQANLAGDTAILGA